MNNLHRELAPISDAAWADLEEETTRTLKRYLAGLSEMLRGLGVPGVPLVMRSRGGPKAPQCKPS